MSASAQKDRQRGRYSHPGPPWYSSPLSARFGPDPLGGYCHSSYIFRQTGENRCDLPLSYLLDRSGGLPVLMAGDLNVKHVHWNSRLNTKRGKLLRDYANENSCLIFGPDTPTTNPYNSSATPDVLDIAILKDLPLPVFVTSCSALSSDHLPVLIDTACRSSFQHPPDRPDFRRTEWANFQTHLEDQITFDPELHNGKAIDVR